MRLVVDTNILFAGTRATARPGLLIDSPLKLLAPERTLAEIRRNAETIAARSDLTLDGVALLLALLTEDIEIVPPEAFEDQIQEAQHRIGDKDPGDVPFLALALARPASDLSERG